MNAPYAPQLGAVLRLQHIGSKDEASKPYDAAVLRLIGALDALAPAVRPQPCADIGEQAEEAERMAGAAGKVRQAIADFLVRWVNEADGWIGALSETEDADFHRNPLEMFDLVLDAWEQFAADNRERQMDGEAA